MKIHCIKYLSSIALAGALLVVISCAQPQKLKGTGEIVTTPYGYIRLCQEQPNHAVCNTIPASPATPAAVKKEGR